MSSNSGFDDWESDTTRAEGDHQSDPQSDSSTGFDPDGDTSAFSDPPSVQELDAQSSMVEPAENDATARDVDEPAAGQDKPKGQVNKGVLALAGALILGAIGGGGYVLYGMLAGGGQPTQNVEAVMPVAPAPSPATGAAQPGATVSGADALTPGSSQDAPADIFGDKTVNAPAETGDTVQGAPNTHGDAVTPASQGAVSIDTKALELQTQEAMAVSDKPRPAGPSGATAREARLKAEQTERVERQRAMQTSADSVAVAGAAVTAAVSGGASCQCEAQGSKVSKGSKAVKSRSGVQVAALSGTGAAKKTHRKRRAAKKAVKPVPTEEFVLPAGLKLMAIYPLSGPNSQAWVRDNSGKLHIYRAGDRIAPGISIQAINGRENRVVTTAGNIVP